MRELNYKLRILEYSLLINEAQRPIQILDAVKWNDEVSEFFLKNHFKEIPKIDAKFYAQRPLKYDPIKKIAEFKAIREKISEDKILQNDDLAKILIRNCNEYEEVVFMLMQRGSKKFYQHSKKLYGSANETLSDGTTKLFELAIHLNKILNSLTSEIMGAQFDRSLTSDDVVLELKNRLGTYFKNEAIKVKLSDGIISDASAGSDYIKIKSGITFSFRDVHVFEVHEGQVHLGTTLNGENQEYAKWLSKGPPCSTVTQEGLAVLIELISYALYPKRAKKLNDRLMACKMAEDGANVLEVIEYFRLQGLNEYESISNAGRIFRGADLNGGAPFTKDISYLKGFVEIYNFLRTSIQNGNPDLIPFLFVGKVTLEDIPILYKSHKEGVINYPKYLPPAIKDLNGFFIWMAFSNFFDKMQLENIEHHREKTNIIKIA